MEIDCPVFHLKILFIDETIFFLAPQKRLRLTDPLKYFRLESLKRHNDKRALHCVSALTLDTNLNTISQDLAEKLAAADVIPPVYQSSRFETVYYGQGNEGLVGKGKFIFV
jgi:uncharacterized protein YkwD